MAEVGTSLRKVEKPEMITVGKRQVISSMQWNNDLMADWVIANAREKWIPIGKLASRAYGRDSEQNRHRVRKCISRLFIFLLTLRGEVLAVEYGAPNHGASAIKLYDGASELERQSINIKLDRMRQRSNVIGQY